MNKKLTKDLEDIMGDDTLSHKEKTKRHEAVDRRLSLWRRSRRIVVLKCIMEEDGSPSPSLQRSAELLEQHWSQVFASKLVDDDAIQQLLEHVPRLHNQQHHLPSFDDFKTMVMHTGNSAPGPDGVPHAFWRSAFDAVGVELYQFLGSIWACTQ